MKFGGEFRHASVWVHYYRNARGSFSFVGNTGPWANDPSFSGIEKAFADYLGGYIGAGQASFATGDPVRTWYVLSGAGYFTDTWQVKPTLSVNYGVRYDYNTPFYDPTHTISTWWPTFKTSDPKTPGLAFPGAAGSPISSLYPPDKNNFAPRLGFAWTPKRGGKTVIRGSWGLYYDVLQAHLFVDSSAGDSSNSGASRNPGGANPVFNVSTTSTVIVQKDAPIFGASLTPAPPWGLWAVDQGFRNPYTQNFTLNVQQQLTSHTILQVAYVGSQARKEAVNVNMNAPRASVTDYANVQAARPYNATFPMYSGITRLETAGNAHYNALQVSLRSTTWKGLSGQISYTLSRAWDDMSGARYNFPADQYNLKGDWGHADFDTPHAMSGYLVYDLPQLGHSVPRLTKGWEVSSYFAADAGFRFYVGGPGNLSHTYQYHDRANLIGDPFAGVTQPGPLLKVGGVAFFNPKAFTANDPGTFGTVQRNQFRSLPYHNIDFAVIKNTNITEKVIAQLRFEMFNVFNILNLGCLDGGYLSGTGGMATCTLSTGNGAPGIGPGEPFNLQLALKLKW